jgi:Flp pilus assembly protein TadG
MSSRTSAARSRTGHRRPADRGQATVELALLLPVLVLLVLLVIQLGLFTRDQILVTHAAREGARASAVDDSADAVEKAVRSAGPLDPRRLHVRISGRHGRGSRVTVTVTYDAETRVPLLRAIVGHVALHAAATMRVER